MELVNCYVCFLSPSRKASSGCWRGRWPLNIVEAESMVNENIRYRINKIRTCVSCSLEFWIPIVMYLQFIKVHSSLGLCHSLGDYSLASQIGGPSSIAGQVMWDIWWTKWHSEYFCFPYQLSFDHCSTLIIDSAIDTVYSRYEQHRQITNK
jgi:hypothetical protein